MVLEDIQIINPRSKNVKLYKKKIQKRLNLWKLWDYFAKKQPFEVQKKQGGSE